jgi:hypothetical protein
MYSNAGTGVPFVPPTPHLPLGPFITENVMTSVEAFLYTNVVLPYNSAVANTSYSTPVTILMQDPDDYSITASVPVIVLTLPDDVSQVNSTGMADGLVWNYMEVGMNVYPGLSTSPDGSQKPILHSATYLRSLLLSVKTALTLPLYDYTQTPPALVDFAYIEKCKVTELKGALKNMLALEKHRFDFTLGLRFVTPALNG